MPKLKLQYFGHPTQRTNSLEKTQTLGKIEGEEEKEVRQGDMVQWHHQLNGHEFELTPGDREGQGMLQSMGSQRLWFDLATEQQNGLQGLKGMDRMDPWRVERN